MTVRVATEPVRVKLSPSLLSVRLFTVHLFVEFVLRQVGRQRRQLTESQQRLLLHEVARLHVGLAVERPVGLQETGDTASAETKQTLRRRVLKTSSDG